MGENRKWIEYCDGLLYHMLIYVIKETRTCAVCQSAFMDKDPLKSHFDGSHEENDSAELYFKFDWVVLKIGSGHFEMSMAKSINELNWVPLMEHLCVTMGFSSDTTNTYAKNVIFITKLGL